MKNTNDIRVANLKELLAKSGKNQTEFANTIGRSQSQLGQWLNGHKPIGEKIARSIESMTGLPDNFLDNDKDNKNTEAVEPNTFKIPEYNVKLAAGLHGSEVINPENIIRHHVINDTFLHEFRVKQENLAVVSVLGNSMDPTLRDGEKVIIDKSCKTPIDNRVFAITTKNQTWAKRMRITPSGERWCSDNEEYQKFDNELNDGKTIRIEGIVLYSLGRKVF